MTRDELRCEWFHGAGRLGLGVIAEVKRPRWKLLPAPLPADVVLRSCTGLPPEGQSFLDAYLIDSKRLEHSWAICTVMICFGCTCWPGLITVYTCPLGFSNMPPGPGHALFIWFMIFPIQLLKHIWSSRASSWGLKCSNGLRSLAEYSSHIL